MTIHALGYEIEETVFAAFTSRFKLYLPRQAGQGREYMGAADVVSGEIIGLHGAKPHTRHHVARIIVRAGIAKLPE